MEIHLNLPGRRHQRHSRPRRAGSPEATPAGHSVTLRSDAIQPRSRVARAKSTKPRRRPAHRAWGWGAAPRVSAGKGAGRERRTRLGPRPGVAPHPLRRSRRAVSPPRWELIPQAGVAGIARVGPALRLRPRNRPRHSPETQHCPEPASAHSPSLSAMAAAEPGGVGGPRGRALKEGRGSYERSLRARGLYCFLRPVRGGPARVPSRQHWPIRKRGSGRWAERPRRGLWKRSRVAFRGSEARAPPLSPAPSPEASKDCARAPPAWTIPVQIT